LDNLIRFLRYGKWYPALLKRLFFSYEIIPKNTAFIHEADSTLPLFLFISRQVITPASYYMFIVFFYFLLSGFIFALLTFFKVRRALGGSLAMLLAVIFGQERRENMDRLLQLQASFIHPITNDRHILSSEKIEYQHNYYDTIEKVIYGVYFPQVKMIINNTVEIPCTTTIPVEIEVNDSGHVAKHIYDAEVSFNKPIEINMRLVDNKWYPMVWASHTYPTVTGWWARKIIINEQVYWAYRKPNDAAPLPVLDVIKGPIPVWTHAAAKGCLIHFIGDDGSLTGYHYREYDEVRADYLYVIKRILQAPPAWRAGTEALVSQHTGNKLSWYVKDGLYCAWLLEKAGEVPPYVRILAPEPLFVGQLPQPTYQQGNLYIYQLKMSTDVSIWDIVKERTIYNHTLHVNWWLRWYDGQNNWAMAIAHIPHGAYIQAVDHEYIQPPSGWYLLVHPRPTTNID